MDQAEPPNPELARLAEDGHRQKNWKRWGPYLAERQWGTVREDYSVDGESWNYFTHDQARSRAYRWGEDGLLGLSDRECRLCFALALWNERDPILKERLFGLTNTEGNHGEDVKECYFYLDATPTHSWLQALYKYPQAAFPYERLRTENGRRSRLDPEFELLDTGVFDAEPVFRRPGRVRQGRSERSVPPGHGHQPRAGRRPAARAADALVSQHLVLGLPARGLRGEAAAGGHFGFPDPVRPSDPGALFSRPGARAGRKGGAMAVHGERNQCRAALRRGECLAPTRRTPSMRRWSPGAGRR